MANSDPIAPIAQVASNSSASCSGVIGPSASRHASDNSPLAVVGHGER
jgi:hypothetical protein